MSFRSPPPPPFTQAPPHPLSFSSQLISLSVSFFLTLSSLYFSPHCTAYHFLFSKGVNFLLCGYVWFCVHVLALEFVHSSIENFVLIVVTCHGWLHIKSVFWYSTFLCDMHHIVHCKRKVFVSLIDFHNTRYLCNTFQKLVFSLIEEDIIWEGNVTPLFILSSVVQCSSGVTNSRCCAVPVTLICSLAILSTIIERCSYLYW